MKFTVKRSEWLRGKLVYDDKGCNNSCLLRGEDNMKCCLGFLALAAGYNENEIVNQGDPETSLDWSKRDRGVKNNWPTQILETYSYKNTRACTKIIHINDDADINDSQRESELIKNFATIGIEVEFVD